MKIIPNQKGFAALEIALVLVIAAIIGGTGYYIYQATKKSSQTYNAASKAALTSTATGSVKTVDYSYISNINQAPVAARPVVAAAINPIHKACQAQRQTTKNSPDGQPFATVYAVNQATANTVKVTAACGEDNGFYLFGQYQGKWHLAWHGNGIISCSIISKYQLSDSIVNHDYCTSLKNTVYN